jgi:DNA-binding beta-propeller fold protein YncE
MHSGAASGVLKIPQKTTDARLACSRAEPGAARRRLAPAGSAPYLERTLAGCRLGDPGFVSATDSFVRRIAVTFGAFASVRPVLSARMIGAVLMASALGLAGPARPVPIPVYVREWGAEGAAVGELKQPRGITVDSQGTLYITDSMNHRIVKYDSTGTLLATWGSFGTGPGQFDHPVDIEADAIGHLFIVDENNRRVVKLTTSGEYVLSWTGSADGDFNLPFAVGVGPDGSVYISENFDGSIQHYTNDGAYLGRWGTPGGDPGQFSLPLGIAVDRAGNVFVSDVGNNNVQKFTATGGLLARWGGTGSAPGLFMTAFGITIDPSGNVLVVDHHNFRIQIFSNAGDFLGMWGTKGVGPNEFASSHGMTCDARGQIYVLDFQGSVSCCYVQKYASPTVPVRAISWADIKAAYGGKTPLQKPAKR